MSPTSTDGITENKDTEQRSSWRILEGKTIVNVYFYSMILSIIIILIMIVIPTISSLVEFSFQYLVILCLYAVLIYILFFTSYIQHRLFESSYSKSTSLSLNDCTTEIIRRLEHKEIQYTIVNKHKILAKINKKPNVVFYLNNSMYVMALFSSIHKQTYFLISPLNGNRTQDLLLMFDDI